MSTFAQAPPKPNVIVIFTDDHGWADLGANGARTDVRTPNLDALAGAGVRMTNGHVTAPQCVPSRAGLLTGRYQTRFGVETNDNGPLPAGEKTLADRMKAAGYATGMVGKWHLSEKGKEGDPDRARGKPAPAEDPFLPGRRGFDDYFCGTMTTFVASYGLDGRTFDDAPRRVKDERFRIDVQTEAALAFVDRHAKEPFFLYLAYFAPHVPLQADETYLARFPDVKEKERRLALAMISAVDDGAGRIVEALRKHGIEERTQVWFIGDNGAPITRGAWNGSLNDPLVGEKGMLTDGGTRTPYFVTWKGVLPAGKLYEKPVISLDVAATATAAAGLPPDAALDGTDLLPFLTGKKEGDPHDSLFWRWCGQAAVRAGRWKLVTLGADRRWLFDLESPEGERKNRTAEHPEVADGLEKRLRDWCAVQSPSGLPEQARAQDEAFYQAHLTGKGVPPQVRSLHTTPR